MCDKDTVHGSTEHPRKFGITRRQFGTMAASVSLLTMLPPVANAQAVTESEVEITTPDGVCDAYFVHPAGASAAVLMWPDIFGLRSAFRAMGKRLAESGYAVLVVNPFYRVQHAPTSADGESFADPGVRDKLLGLMGALTAETNTLTQVVAQKECEASANFAELSKQINQLRAKLATEFGAAGALPLINVPLSG